MIRHCVFVQFHDDVTKTQRDQLYQRLASLQSVVPGMLNSHFGENVSPESLAKGFNDGFIIDFSDAAARDAYLAHPEHKAAGQALVALLQHGIDSLIVFDLEISEEI